MSRYSVARDTPYRRVASSSGSQDLLIDHGDGRYTRVQCKTGILRDGCVLFRLYSTSGHDTRTKPYTGQVDAFGVYCPQTRCSYLVPVTALVDCRLFATLRIEPAKNGQRTRTRSAEEFAIS